MSFGKRHRTRAKHTLQQTRLSHSDFHPRVPLSKSTSPAPWTTLSRMHRLSLFISLCTMLILSGCSSIGTRSIQRMSSPPPPLYFGGTRLDHQIISHANETPWFMTAYGVVDMPFSLCGDTILLPYDLYTDLRHPNDEPSETNDKSQPAP
jgi:uncharacterized protein YceK